LRQPPVAATRSAWTASKAAVAQSTAASALVRQSGAAADSKSEAD